MAHCGLNMDIFQKVKTKCLLTTAATWAGALNLAFSERSPARTQANVHLELQRDNQSRA